MQTLIFCSLITGAIVILLLFFRRKLKSNNWLLALTLLCVWYCLFVNNLNATGEILDYPFLIRTGNITAYLIYPLLYLYIRNIFYPGQQWQKFIWLVFMPAIFYIIDMWPFYFAPAAYKVDIMAQNLANPKQMFTVSEGWLATSGFHFIFRYLWAVFFFALQVNVLYRNRNYDNNLAIDQNRPLYFFLVTITLLFLPLIVPGIFGVLFHLSWYNLTFMNISMAITLLTIAVYMLLSPRVLYGFYPAVNFLRVQQLTEKVTNELLMGNIIENQPETTTAIPEYTLTNDAKSVPYKTDKMINNGEMTDKNRGESLHLLTENTVIPFDTCKEPSLVKIDSGESSHALQNNLKTLPPETIEKMTEMIKEYLNTSKPYRKVGYSIHDLSKDTSIPVYQLSPIINQYFGAHFNNWLNVFRVNYVIELASEPDNKHLTYEALAQKAGFSSRATFISAFKKEKCCTPGMYLKKLSA